MEQVPTNQLMHLCSPLFDLITMFHQIEKTQDIDFRETAVNHFNRFEHESRTSSYSLEDIQHAKYALAALVDEMVMGSQWENKHQWMAKTLQMEFFGESSAGEGFFNHLSEIRQHGKEKIDVIEIYFACLELGFEGKYRMQGIEKLTGLQVDLQNQIDKSRGHINKALSPNAIPKEGFVRQVSREVPFWVICSITMALIFSIYVGYSFVIEHQANKSVEKINQYYQQILYPSSKDNYLKY